MNMKRNLINVAVLSTLGVAGTAGAVTTGSLGQVLIYPYYSVRNGNDTLVTVVNTMSTANAVKVRFLEAKNSREVLDFNLYLSPKDVWTGVITQTATGAKIVSTDKSCTVPALPVGGVEFRNFQYTGDNADGEDVSLNRTREGYVEIIEMGTVNHVDIDPSSSTVYFDTAVTHTASGVPSNCAGRGKRLEDQRDFHGFDFDGQRPLITRWRHDGYWHSDQRGPRDRFLLRSGGPGRFLHYARPLRAWLPAAFSRKRGSRDECHLLPRYRRHLQLA